MSASVPSLRDRFEALGPWYTRFEIDGETYGGTAPYEADYRVGLFFEWIEQPASILELSSFEGGHSLRLAEPPFVERLMGLEGRAENIERARFVADLLGRGNIEFAQADLDRDPLAPYGRFDAVFCAGLLYHLTRPWRLLEEIAQASDRLFLDTHYSPTEETEVDGYVGSIYHEPPSSTSGLSKSSFWMTLPCLRDTLSRAGFMVVHEEDKLDWSGLGPRVHLAAIRD
jgi:SAM-dependent methyltransferase